MQHMKILSGLDFLSGSTSPMPWFFRIHPNNTALLALALLDTRLLDTLCTHLTNLLLCMARRRAIHQVVHDPEWSMDSLLQRALSCIVQTNTTIERLSEGS
ncbi:hypothetical protein SCP_0802280 [Sparassis crispa]|uniref:Uncharacterized protein n=1 Tax=Sparassis crispa TaxID=139825 RepID=A0A401GU23_9APHY|nr:hypothetical protein SCP_0802280 [Sparassis crispa]GBE85706.1 hypothetical protein SCP_0802280 [Sparassis crispa]